MYLSIDEGTTNVKGVLFDSDFKPVKVRRVGLRTVFPREGWVEQAPEEIWERVKSVISNIREDIDAIGITNQRETTVVWSVESGKPLHNAIVWSCRRTADYMAHLAEEYSELVKSRTGLEMDAYFSASKIRWILEHVPGAEELARLGKLRFGTIDSYLIWKLTDGEVHATDHTNASRTMLYNIRRADWDDELMALFGVPESMLPEIRDSAAEYGAVRINSRDVPITGVIGDQQSALLAHGCHGEGDAKVTYGTGTFILVNTGTRIIEERGLLSTVAWSIDSRRTYALEGSILSSGTVVEWLKSMGLWVDTVGEETSLYFVPAFFGLGSPYWDPYARGTILGLSAYTNKEHITRAALESIGFMVRDILEIVSSHVPLTSIKVDGGMTRNSFLMQFQADILGVPVSVPKFGELTAMGAALLAALAQGGVSMSEIRHVVEYPEVHVPEKSERWRKNKYEKWHEAVRRSMDWASATWEN